MTEYLKNAMYTNNRRRTFYDKTAKCMDCKLCWYAVFAVYVGSLALTSVGVYVYKNIVENNAQNYQLRVSLSYVATKVHQYDTSGQISVEEENGIPILVLRESLDSGNYRTMLYCYKGKMRELFQEEGLSYSLEDGMEVMELDQLKLKQDGKQIFVKAIENGEQEQLVLNIRSE